MIGMIDYGRNYGLYMGEMMDYIC